MFSLLYLVIFDHSFVFLVHIAQILIQKLSLGFDDSDLSRTYKLVDTIGLEHMIQIDNLLSVTSLLQDNIIVMYVEDSYIMLSNQLLYIAATLYLVECQLLQYHLAGRVTKSLQNIDLLFDLLH